MHPSTSTRPTLTAASVPSAELDSCSNGATDGARDGAEGEVEGANDG